ncbi:MAG: hypothetical protein FWE87_05860 [Coriobacteriia bacterium]|nr:hypothetical protein [Coriobacteriia bacterium]
MKRSLLIILAVLLALALTACTEQQSVSDAPVTEVATEEQEINDAQASAPDPVTEEIDGIEIPAFSITVQDIVITDQEMTNYPVYRVETTSTNTYGTTTTRVYVGYSASDILGAAGVSSDFTTMVTLADDGYQVKVNHKVALEPTTLVAISEDEVHFQTGPWFAPCSSNMSPDYLRDLVSITLEP